MTSKIFQNTLFQIIGKVVTVSIGIVATMMLTRYLGQAGYGEYGLAMTFFALFSTVGNWGVNLIAVREAAKDKERESLIMSNAVMLRVGLSLLSSLVLIFLSFWLPYSDHLRRLIFVAAVMVLVMAVKESFYMVFNLKLKMERWAVCEIIFAVLEIILISWVIWRGLGAGPVLWAIVWSALVASLAAFFLANSLIPFRFKLQKKKLMLLIKESLPMGGILVLFTLYTNLDRFFLSVLPLPELKNLYDPLLIQKIRNEVLGAYSAAYKINDVLVQPAAYVMNSFLPLMALAASTNGNFKKLYSQAFTFIFLLAAPMLAAVFVFAPWAMQVLAPNFSGSVLTLRILVFASFISYFNHLTGFSLVALGRQKFSFYIALISLTLNAALNIVFIPIFSYPAAAAITILTEAVTLTTTLVVVYKISGAFPTLSISKKMIRVGPLTKKPYEQ